MQSYEYHIIFLKVLLRKITDYLFREKDILSKMPKQFLYISNSAYPVMTTKVTSKVHFVWITASSLVYFIILTLFAIICIGFLKENAAALNFEYIYCIFSIVSDVNISMNSDGFYFSRQSLLNMRFFCMCWRRLKFPLLRPILLLMILSTTSGENLISIVQVQRAKPSNMQLSW